MVLSSYYDVLMRASDIGWECYVEEAVEDMVMDSMAGYELLAAIDYIDECSEEIDVWMN